ncbi:hypothetical protein BST61_g3717 [Cercospora zeina]
MPLHHQQPLSTRRFAQDISSEHPRSLDFGDRGGSFAKTDVHDVDTEYDALRTQRTETSIEEHNISNEAAVRKRCDSAIDVNGPKTDRTAAFVVLDTNELLEQILLQADNATILRVQRTSRTWNHVINRCSALYEKLFFKAEVPHCDPSKRNIRWNPLLLHEIFYSPHCPDGCPIVYDGIGGGPIVEVKRLLEAGTTAQIRIPDRYIKHGREESWRRMLLYQGARHTDQLYFHHWSWGGTKLLGPRVTMGQVWDKVGAQREFYASSESLHYHG